MFMFILTRNMLAAAAAERWGQQYPLRPGRPVDDYHDDYHRKHVVLVALGPTPDPADVNKVIGNNVWTDLFCDNCERAVDAVLAIRDSEDAHYEPHARLCMACMAAGLEMLRQDRDALRPWWWWDSENPDVVAHREDGVSLEQLASGGWRSSTGWELMPADPGGFVKHAAALAAFDLAFPYHMHGR